MSILTEPTTVAQVLILAVGIYMLLSFLRAMRGSGLVGLGVVLIVGVYGLWGVAGRLGLSELKHVIGGLLGFVFVLLAIVFQPELRRGMATLGQHKLLGRLLKSHRKEVFVEVAAAVVTMAKKKQGALIAFERKTPLDAYIEGAVALDADVNRYLFDSLFHHGSALHDGAVIIRGDRIVSAATLFPLTENFEISKSTGTRHRAALGVTEEGDTVTVAVSEETGFISICKDGKMERRVPRAQLEEILRNRVGGDEAGPSTDEEPDVERPPLLRRLLTEHTGQKIGALVLAFLVFYGAHQDLIVPKDVSFQIAVERSSVGVVPPGTLRVVMPRADYRMAAGSADECRVRFEGRNEQLDVLKVGVGGVLVLEGELADGPLELDVEEVDWGALTLGEGVRVSWVGDAPVLNLERLDETKVRLEPWMVGVVEDDLGVRYEADRERISFRPAEVVVRGPRAEVESLAAALAAPQPSAGPDGGPRSLLAAVRLGAGGSGVRVLEVSLARELSDAGLALVQAVLVDVPVVPREVELGEIDVPITLPSFGGNGPPTRLFQPPSEDARFRIVTRGLVSGEEGAEEWIADKQALRDFVRDRLRVFVDVDRIAADSRVGVVDFHGLGPWREELPKVNGRFQEACQDPTSELFVELQTESEISLTEIPPRNEDGNGDLDGPQAPGGNR